MLAVIVAAALSPNLGAVPAQTNSQYSQPSSTGLSGWEIGAIAAVVIAAALALAIGFMRRRRPPTAASVPVQPWQGGAGPGAAPPAPLMPPPPPPGPPAAAPAYLETPEDVGQAPPTVTAGKVAGAGATGAAAGAAAEEAEPDIDSLMAELDKISGEILKRAPKKGAAPPAEPAEEEPPH